MALNLPRSVSNLDWVEAVLLVRQKNRPSNEPIQEFLLYVMETALRIKLGWSVHSMLIASSAGFMWWTG